MENKSMVSCQKGPTRHAYAWQIGPFWQDTLQICFPKTVQHAEGWNHGQTLQIMFVNCLHSETPTFPNLCIYIAKKTSNYLAKIGQLCSWVLHIDIY